MAVVSADAQESHGITLDIGIFWYLKGVFQTELSRPGVVCNLWSLHLRPGPQRGGRGRAQLGHPSVTSGLQNPALQ